MCALRREGLPNPENPDTANDETDPKKVRFVVFHRFGRGAEAAGSRGGQCSQYGQCGRCAAGRDYFLSSTSSMMRRICVMSIAPIACCGSPDCGMKRKVGMLRTPNRAASRCSLSTSIL